MAARMIAVTPSAYAYPLLIKHLLHTPLMHARRQEIVDAICGLTYTNRH